MYIGIRLGSQLLRQEFFTKTSEAEGFLSQPQAPYLPSPTAFQA
ncbi:hypothetical protein STRDD11_01653 [Streptococcus sp. DD11]|nr:hypothetical protein STRDD11_01653 [Streptococcus sp. DD11]